MCGHSLGAGIVGLLALVSSLSNFGHASIECAQPLQMWADPKTCLTVRGSGFPSGRRVSGLLIAPPYVRPSPAHPTHQPHPHRCLTSKALSEICKPMLTSFVYSHDVVSRLSLGSIRDLTRAAMWLCTGKGDETPMNITKRALLLHNQLPRGFGVSPGNEETKGEVAWVCSSPVFCL